jgi:hypothetical protein
MDMLLSLEGTSTSTDTGKGTAQTARHREGHRQPDSFRSARANRQGSKHGLL